MSLPAEFVASLSSKTDAALFDIIRAPEVYEAEAIAAAHDELRRRNVTLAIPPVPTQSDLARRDMERRSEEPLPIPLGIAMMTVIPAPVLFFVYLKRGYHRRAFSVWKWAILGLFAFAFLNGLKEMRW